MLKGKFYWIFFLIFLQSFSQEQKKLEQKRKKLQKEIKKINTLLFSNQKKEKNLLQEIANLNIKIQKRFQLIANIESEIENLDEKIIKNSITNNALKKNLNYLKKEYAKIIFKSYKNHLKNNELLFLLSSKNFHQALKRLQYVKQYSHFKEKQAIAIEKKTAAILAINKLLKKQKNKKQELINIYKNQEKIITKDKLKKKDTFKKIKFKEKKYIAQIKIKQKQEKKLDLEIERLIRAAIAASKKKNNKTTIGFKLTPEAKKLTSKFEKNKRKLPWPVKNALVVRKFGKIPHETLKGIILQSNGIQIATKKNANAFPIFEGKIIAVQISKNGIITLMAQHGNYISVYGNLEKINVKKGDKVSLKTKLGRIHTNKITEKTILKFQIWKNTKKQNPEEWLLKL